MSKERYIEAKQKWAEKQLAKGFRPRDTAATDRLPPGQKLTTGFPVLDLGVQPDIRILGKALGGGLLLSFRLISEERQTHSMVLLNTSPVRDSEIVAGKFLAALAFLAMLLGGFAAAVTGCQRCDDKKRYGKPGDDCLFHGLVPLSAAASKRPVSRSISV